jgi:hypothetical protein
VPINVGEKKSSSPDPGETTPRDVCVASPTAKNRKLATGEGAKMMASSPFGLSFDRTYVSAHNSGMAR